MPAVRHRAPSQDRTAPPVPRLPSALLILLVVLTGCGSTGDEPEPATGGSELVDEAPGRLVVSRLASFDEEVLAWGTTPTGAGGLATVDTDGPGWRPITGDGPIPVCAAAVALDDGVALIGNPSTGSSDVVGVVIDLDNRTTSPLAGSPPFTGNCPGAAATDDGFIAWAVDRTEPVPVTAASFSASDQRWVPLPPPPFPAGTYEVGGAWTDDGLHLLAASETQPSFLGARLVPDLGSWEALPPAPVGRWEHPEPFWSGRELLIASAWPQPLTGGEVEPFPEPLAPGGAYEPATRSWRPSGLAPEWTDGAPAWNGEVVIWWRPGNRHATAHRPADDRWWHLAAAALGDASPAPDASLSATWSVDRIVATDGTRVFVMIPDLDDVVELDRSGRPPATTTATASDIAGQRTGSLGLLGPACGSGGRNSIVVDIDESGGFTLDYVVDREEPCGSMIAHEGSIEGTVDLDTRSLTGRGVATVDGRAATVDCRCEITADNRVLGELVVDGTPSFIVAFVDG